ncbi:MAG TPA: hypothetical protein VGD66_02645 [Allosphingosinicella sp.]|jgi:hypothetical protein
MAETKPFASLSSGLLARKGGAKPAMRPQGFGSFGGSLEDLGWNDMGSHEYHEHVPTPIDALTPSPKAAAPAAPAEPPPVVEQQRALRDSFVPEFVPESVPEDVPQDVEEPVAETAEVVPLPQRPALAARAKAAFTLRLDPDRHLKLRLACALSRRSAQQLVTGALDDFLATLPEVEALADRAGAESSRRSRSSR